MQTQKTYKILTLLLVIQWAFIQLIAKYTVFIENFYAKGLYPIISNILQSILGFIKISVGDVLYAFIIVFLLISIYKTIKHKHINFKKTIFKIGGILSVIFFIFYFNWGLNYFREPINKSLNFEIKPYTNNDLYNFTEQLITKINLTQISITKNDTILVENANSKSDIREQSIEVYNQLQQKFPQFKHQKIKVKSSLFSVPLTYMGFGGYLNPFTNEAQVNYLILKNAYTSTVCHELAHQIGIAPESEANFVGYLAATNCNNKYFNYAGYLNALRYCLSNIYYQDQKKFDALMATINKGILKDLQQNQDFWELYQNWTEKYFKNFYDTYLKANQQKDGIKSYSKMLVLLINYHKTARL